MPCNWEGCSSSERGRPAPYGFTGRVYCNEHLRIVSALPLNGETIIRALGGLGAAVQTIGEYGVLMCCGPIPFTEYLKYAGTA